MKTTKQLIDVQFARFNGIFLHGPIMLPVGTPMVVFTDHVVAESWLMDSSRRGRAHGKYHIIAKSTIEHVHSEWEMYTRKILSQTYIEYKCLYFLNTPRALSPYNALEIVAWGCILEL